MQGMLEGVRGKYVREVLTMSDEAEPNENVKTCWNCQNKHILWITEAIHCHIKDKSVYLWEALDCEKYEREHIGD